MVRPLLGCRRSVPLRYGAKTKNKGMIQCFCVCSFCCSVLGFLSVAWIIATLVMGSIFIQTSVLVVLLIVEAIATVLACMAGITGAQLNNSPGLWVGHGTVVVHTTPGGIQPLPGNPGGGVMMTTMQQQQQQQQPIQGTVIQGTVMGVQGQVVQGQVMGGAVVQPQQQPQTVQGQVIQAQVVQQQQQQQPIQAQVVAAAPASTAVTVTADATKQTADV